MSEAETQDAPTPPDRLSLLLAQSKVRAAPPTAIEAEVRAAVHAEWLHLTQTRKRRRQRRWLVAAAVLAVSFIGGWLAHNLNNPASQAPSTPSVVIAEVLQLQGSATLNQAGMGNHDQLRTGDSVQSGAASGLRIMLNTGIELRIASSTQLRWLNANTLQLDHGSIYVNSHGQSAALVVRTARGDITHLGTRYFVDVDANLLRVGVREGHAIIHAGAQQLDLNALQQLEINTAQTSRSDLQLNDVHWQWADALAEPFALENRNVDEFLHWVTTETGFELHYASAAVQAAATHTVLHGQPTTLAPLQAMQRVLITTDFHAITQGKQLLITQQH